MAFPTRNTHTLPAASEIFRDRKTALTHRDQHIGWTASLIHDVFRKGKNRAGWQWRLAYTDRDLLRAESVRQIGHVFPVSAGDRDAAGGARKTPDECPHSITVDASRR